MIDPESKDERVEVVFVAKGDAKRVKDWLQRRKRLSDRHRLCSSTDDNHPACIAIPILGDLDFDDLDEKIVLGRGRQPCPLKSSHFASQMNQSTSVKQLVPDTEQIQVSSREEHFNKIQATLFYVLNSLSDSLLDGDQLACSIALLDERLCPSKIQLFGDDRTLVLPEGALFLGDDDSPLIQLLVSMGIDSSLRQQETMNQVYSKLAADFHSPRIARKCRIDPDSAIRESNFIILWHQPSCYPKRSGPGSVEWIAVTENGIRQSFDLTRVMFSRGNVSEKQRFGKSLVQAGEMVLDMYAGIGYFTLPALIHGKAKHVVACEWNPHAANALTCNLVDNDVEDRATVHVGDCRAMAKAHNLIGMFDRVSLGLLPSSEGGWETSVRALKFDTGGWLHVHGNVPVKEHAQWFQWLCVCLGECARRNGLTDWSVLGSHLQKVKSFAPTVSHYVADVWLGPVSAAPNRCGELLQAGVIGIMESGRLVVLDELVEAPSCALSDDGALNQAWMR